ncbi:fused MFS/spermidine synthase [Cellulomonas cellasea]|uniref:spermidine synthase n=1 Tax=Cellulomonas cellasea TaxID=43670 RepID=UPI0025A36275|nr:fused MFS/spermidine synthase [Cellulomonas cellasea]MDM8085819.1 fused MFS/spermidine synthase [Cellulomonas cellasea]
MRAADDPSGVTVLVNGVPSSHLDLEDPRRLSFEYMQQMAVLLGHTAPAGEPLAVVHLGAAGCALARHVHATRPGSRQIAVELDTALPELVRTWFDLPRAPALRIRAGDARAQLEAMADASADVVVRDVFAGDRTPEHVTTVEFAREVARVLRPGGLYLANCADRPPLALARSEAATLLAVFGHLGVVAEPGLLRGRGYGNVVLAATDSGALLASTQVEREVRSLPAPARLLTGEEMRAFVGAARVLADPPEAAEPAAGGSATEHAAG